MFDWFQTFAQQLPTMRHNMQVQGVQTDETFNIQQFGSCWQTMLHLFACSITYKISSPSLSATPKGMRRPFVIKGYF